jgi:hypothetical protein
VVFPGYNVAEVGGVIAARSTIRGKLEWCTVISLGDQVLTPTRLEERDGHLTLTINDGVRSFVLCISDSGVSEAHTPGDHPDEAGLPSKSARDTSRVSQGSVSRLSAVDDRYLAREADVLCRDQQYSADVVAECMSEFEQRLARIIDRGEPNFGLLGALGDYASFLRGKSTPGPFKSVQGTRAPLYLAGDRPIELSDKNCISINMVDAVHQFSEGGPGRKRLLGVSRSGGLAIPYGLIPGTGETLLVLFHGALRRERASLPSLAGYSVATELGLPTVTVSDPTLDLDARMTLGWYLGNRHCDLPAEIAGELMALCRERGYSSILLCGSSGGGFGALATACHLDGVNTRVLAFNPQTDITRYYPDASTRALWAAFGQSGPGDFHARINIGELANSTESSFSVELVQNSGDRFHIRNHTAPMLDELPDGVRVRVTEIDQGPGHHSATGPQMVEHIRRILGESASA